jgi:hypothetical protein
MWGVKVFRGRAAAPTPLDPPVWPGAGGAGPAWGRCGRGAGRGRCAAWAEVRGFSWGPGSSGPLRVSGMVAAIIDSIGVCWRFAGALRRSTKVRFWTDYAGQKQGIQGPSKGWRCVLGHPRGPFQAILRRSCLFASLCLRSVTTSREQLAKPVFSLRCSLRCGSTFGVVSLLVITVGVAAGGRSSLSLPLQ